MIDQDMPTMDAPQLHEHQGDGHQLVSDLETIAGVAATGYALWRFKTPRIIVALVLVHFPLGTWLIEGYPAGLLWLVPAAGFILWGVREASPLRLPGLPQDLVGPRFVVSLDCIHQLVVARLFDPDGCVRGCWSLG